MMEAGAWKDIEVLHGEFHTKIGPTWRGKCKTLLSGGLLVL